MAKRSTSLLPPLPPAPAAAELMQCFKPHINNALNLLALVPRCVEDIVQLLRNSSLPPPKSANLLDGNHLTLGYWPVRRNILVTTMCYPAHSSKKNLSFNVSCSPEIPNVDSNSYGVVESTEMFERGPAFFGDVFSMWDASETGLIGVRPSEPKNSRIQIPGFFPLGVKKFLKRALPGLFKVKVQEPIFRFYIEKSDAEDYVKDVGPPGSIAGSLPLDAAYKIYKENSSMFSFIPNEKQVRLAKQVITKLHGRKEALKFEGVPVFFTQNLTICLLTSNGMKWFRPYFFEKRRLDVLIRSSVDQYYKMLIRNRRMQRYTQESDTDLFGDLAEDDLETLEPLEVQEFMEELGQNGYVSDTALAKSINVSMQDLMDNLIFGNKWSRRLIGIQPSFPIHVESFQERAAAAELQDNQGVVAQLGIDSDSSGIELSQLRSPTKDAAGSSPAIIDQIRSQGNSRESEAIHSNKSTFGHEKPENKKESTELQLTILGFATYGPSGKSDMSSIMKDLSSIVDDLDTTTSQTSRQHKELNPVFITDLKLPGEA